MTKEIKERLKGVVILVAAILVAAALVALLGCNIPREGIVLHTDTHNYDDVVCEAYTRTPIEKAMLICQVKEEL